MDKPETSQAIIDTQPFPVDALNDSARTTLRKVLDVFNSIREDNRKYGGSRQRDLTGTPWARLDYGRTYRVVMLDGERGTGKTSLLLTLIQQWNRRRERTRGVQTNRERELFPNSDVGVRVLPPLDFDPHPNHLHPYAWIVLAFESVVDWLDQRQSRARLDERPDKTLGDHWRDIYKDALLGWDEEAHRELLTSDVDNYVISMLESHRGWHRLRNNWQAFLDLLLAHLERCGEIEAEDLLVVPLDDLDLHPSMAGDLLRALRLMRHDRLVFLLTGDRNHLRKVLTRELMPCQPNLKSLSPEWWEKTLFECERLAADIIDKVIPPLNTCTASRLTFGEALGFIRQGRASWSADLLKDEEWSDYDRALIKNWIEIYLLPSYRWRDIVQVPRHWNLTRIVERLCGLTRQTNGQPMFTEHISPNGMTTFSATTELRIVLEPDYCRVAATHEARILVCEEFKASVLPSANIMVPAAALILAYLKPKALSGVSLHVSDWSQLLVTEWNNDHMPLRIGWPSHDTPRTLRDLARDQKVLVDLVAKIGRAERNGASVFAAWLVLNMRMPWNSKKLLPSIERLFDELRANTGDPALEELRHKVLEWSEERLPVLAAPEFGLPLDTVKTLLDWALSRMSHGDLLAQKLAWEAERSDALLDAFKRDGSPSATTRVREALKWMAVEFRHHPWYLRLQDDDHADAAASPSDG